MAAPTMTFNARGNLRSNQTIATSGTLSTDVDASTKFEVQLQVEVTFGTVAATSGLQVDVFREFGAGPTLDTIAMATFVIPSTASTSKIQSIALPTGKYSVKLTNTDATNAVTAVYLTSSAVDTVA